MPHLEFISSVIPYVTIAKYLLDLLKSKHYCVSIRYNNTLTIRKCNRGGCDKQA